MAVDNEIYDRLGWWAQDEFIYLLRAALNPVRFAYFDRVVQEYRGHSTNGIKALDVGCGGGFMAEEFAEAGYAVTGIDPSRPAIEVARAHAQERGMAIDYEVGYGEQLPFDDAEFDVVYCCDTLEHVRDPALVVREAARVLKDDGLYLYDTINRTARSKLIWIKIAQDWRATRFLPSSLHDWQMFLKPRQLQGLLVRAGLHGEQVVGIAPANQLALLKNVIELKRGRLSYAELGERMRLRPSRDTSGSYMGFATRAPQPDPRQRAAELQKS